MLHILSGRSEFNSEKEFALGPTQDTGKQPNPYSLSELSINFFLCDIYHPRKEHQQ